MPLLPASVATGAFEISRPPLSFRLIVVSRLPILLAERPGLGQGRVERFLVFYILVHHAFLESHSRELGEESVVFGIHGLPER